MTPPVTSRHPEPRPPFLLVEPAAPDSGFALMLRLRAAEPRLAPRTAATALRAPHPGTAVRYGDRLYEVIARLDGEPPYPVVYGLAPQLPSDTIRTLFDLSAEGLARYEAERQREASEDRRLKACTLLLPCVGLLPKHRLEALKDAVGLDPLHAARVSALALLALTLPPALYASIARFALALASGGGDLWVPSPAATALLLYFTFESIARLRSTEPLGSLPVAFAVALLEALKLLDPPAETLAERARRAARQAARLADRVSRLPAPGGCGQELVIESAIQKPWPDDACIAFDGRCWQIAERSERTRQGRTLHICRLVESEPGTPGRVILYSPVAARDAVRADDQRTSLDRLAVFKPFLGFLPAERQLRWAAAYGFDARGATLQSAAIELVLSAPSLVNALVLLAFVADPPAWPLLRGIIAAPFVLEGGLRLRHALHHGQPSGCWLFAWLGGPPGPRRD